MISSTFVPLFAIYRPVSMTHIVGMLGPLLFLVVTHNRFLRRILRSTHGYLLRLFPRHQHLQKTQIFRRIDHFCWWQKGGEILTELSLGELSLGIFIFVFLSRVFYVFGFMYEHMFCVVCIWFWGWHKPLCMYGHISAMVFILIAFTYVGCMWYMWFVYCFLYHPPICHFIGGWR